MFLPRFGIYTNLVQDGSSTGWFSRGHFRQTRRQVIRSKCERVRLRYMDATFSTSRKSYAVKQAPLLVLQSRGTLTVQLGDAVPRGQNHDGYSGRLSGRDESGHPTTPVLPSFFSRGGGDSAGLSATVVPFGRWRSIVRPFRSDELASRLGERDWDIMTTVRSFKYLTTRQICRQHFGLEAGNGPIPRHANHALARLRELGLLTNLDRRIGGVRAGSGGHVWQITDLARRLMGEHFNGPASGRIRVFEPSTTFLEHTLAVAEVVISLQEVVSNSDITLAHLRSNRSAGVHTLDRQVKRDGSNPT